MKDDFFRGYAVALTTLTKGWKDYHTARMILTESGFTINDFIKAGVDDFDIKELKKIYNT